MALGQPTLVQISAARLVGLVAVLLGMIVLSGMILLVVLGRDQQIAILAPYLVPFVYMLTARRLVARHHRRGCRAYAGGNLEMAIAEMEASDAFFRRHPWLDRWRLVTMLSPSAISYREMALLNIGFFNVQLGRKEAAKAAYGRLLAEFPESQVGKQTLTMIETFERPDTD
ncbi:MAG: hypothetical protein HKM95_16795 [Inquilinus sp.]|nr:hypothetical protein [Inquilinus sp.]